MSPAKKKTEWDDGDGDIDSVRIKWPLGSFEGRGDWIDRHGRLLIKAGACVVIAAFIAFVAVRIWGR